MTTPELRSMRWSVDEVDGQRMKTLALLLGDPNPIHLDGRSAARLGFGSKQINQGPSTIALIYNMFETHAPDARVRRLRVRLLGNVVAGQTVVVTGHRVEAGQDETHTGPAVYQVEVSADGVAVVAGRVELESRGEEG